MDSRHDVRDIFTDRPDSDLMDFRHASQERSDFGESLACIHPPASATGQEDQFVLGARNTPLLNAQGRAPGSNLMDFQYTPQEPSDLESLARVTAHASADQPFATGNPASLSNAHGSVQGQLSLRDEGAPLSVRVKTFGGGNGNTRSPLSTGVSPLPSLTSSGLPTRPLL